MKVRDLIETLTKEDPDAEVAIEAWEPGPGFAGRKNVEATGAKVSSAYGRKRVVILTAAPLIQTAAFVDSLEGFLEEWRATLNPREPWK